MVTIKYNSTKMLKIATRQDIVDFEQQAIPALSTSVYEVIAGSVAKYPERTALRFFLQGNHYQNHVAYTYLELMGKINA
ncbi:MAG: hypothetical protein AB8G86_08420, partial [Saprospiraceae bacterium]